MTLDPPVFLAPMAGITDLPFRRLVARFGAGLVVSEMVASGEMLTARPSVRAKARVDLGLADGVTSVQLAGREAQPMAEAARMVADMGARIIDINMGCPAKKVTGGLSGSALMRAPDRALRLIEAVVAAVQLPVTLKMRLGWDDSCLNAAEIARRAEAAGVAMICVHGRTRMQFYKGSADWEAISAVKAAVRVPVVANGDIIDAPTAQAARAASGADAVMVGRGAQGRPWALAKIAHALHGCPAPQVPVGEALSDMISQHYEDMLSFYGVEVGCRQARKHLGWYASVAGAPLRAEMLLAASPAATLALIRRAFASGERVAA
ncbi:tRNA dihydrouridine synthase DusB [Phaeovulum sp.]|uniref:tRNA dihydrouridine synthase DusB n=1 Tax=Phaeovulum sp. TaxID=2934796 RepID=UPI0035211E0C